MHFSRGAILFLLLFVTVAISIAASVNTTQQDAKTLPKRLLKPRDAVAFAAADAKLLAELDDQQHTDIAKQVRYISLYNYLPEERALKKQTVDFVLNSLSKRKTISYTEVVPGTEDSLLRVHLTFYDIDLDAWDSLGKHGSGPVVVVKKIDQPEPYFHQQKKNVHNKPVKKTRQVTKTDAYGRQYTTTETYEEKGEQEEKIELYHAAWLNPVDIADLALNVGSDFPMYRGDWFVANALLNPAYKNFLGVKTLPDFQKLTKFVRDQDLEIQGVVSDSNEVALHQRAALYTQTRAGYYWETFDFFTSVGDDDLLANLLSRKRDAGEIIATLPNSLQAYVLVNGKDEVIDFADPNVAIDMRTEWKNKLVWSCYSCITCHDQGIKDVADEVRVLSKPPFGLLSKRSKDFKQVIDLFSAPIEEPVDVSKNIYKRAIYLSTKGLSPQQNVTALKTMFLGYVQEDLDMNAVALEVGADPDQIRDILGRTVGPDHTLTQLLAGRPVRRDQFEYAGFSQMAILTVNSK